ncbi:hypothetical protein HDR61_03490 [bacterium]|nr:hypothetical protein [bacterium]
MEIKWKKLFDWSVCGVQRYIHSAARDTVVYQVDVLYRHHGVRHVRFPLKYGATDAERELVLKKANAYFDKMHAKMQSDTKTR